MRILIAHSFYRQTGGEDRYVLQQAELLSQRHEVEILSRDNADLVSRPDAALRLTFSPTELRSARRSVARFRPDIIHVHNVYPSFGPAIHLAAKRRIPLVMTVHNYRLRCPNGLMFTEGKPCRRCQIGAYWNATLHDCFPTRSQAAAYAIALAAHRFVIRLESRVDLFVAPSRFIAERLESWKIDASRIAHVPNFTSVVGAPPPLGESGLFLGRLVPEKGVAVLIEALRMAGDPPFEIGGDGPSADALRAQAQRSGLRRTTFLGQLDRAGVNAAIARARYLTMPSLWDEVAPLGAMEGLAAGRPLVASRVGGLTEIVGGNRGIVVPPGNAERLAAAIRKLAEDPALAAEQGRKANAFATVELSPDVHLERLEAAYERVMGRRS
jgi:glycosyltransferase involved in cell wall biosynthesis